MSERKIESVSSGRAGVLRRLLRDRTGNTMVIIAMALVPIMAMVGSGVDVARTYAAKQRLQNACDAAALAARRDMAAGAFDTAAETEGLKYFNFNFPAGTMNTTDLDVDIQRATNDASVVQVTASANVNTTIMKMFGWETIAIEAECDADKDYVNNDIMIVLDVTLSMNCKAGTSCTSSTTEQSGSRVSRIRTGTKGIYLALKDAQGVRTRYGFMPYSMGINVGRDLVGTNYAEDYIRNPAPYRTGTANNQLNTSTNHNNAWIDAWKSNTTWKTTALNKQNIGCVEERATIGQSGATAINILTSVSKADIDTVSKTNVEQQWSPYDQDATIGESGGDRLESFCPAPATRLKTFSTETDFQTYVTDAVSRVGGYTYHDLGIIWAMRYLSSSGMFSADNPTEFQPAGGSEKIRVDKHIVFMTDGLLQVNDAIYSAYGIDKFHKRLGNTGAINTRQKNRFWAACNRAKEMGMTIWVIALDVTSGKDDVKKCATDDDHFYTSDGTDIQEIFELIGRGIGRLRLTK